MPSKRDKSKVKRKRGKKFVYSQSTQPKNTSAPTTNPFDVAASKKFMKTSQYDDLRKEYRSMGQNSSFVDNRIGENSKNLTEEQKQMLRFKAQQMLLHKKSKSKATINNQNSTLTLTHKGKTINDKNANDSDSFDNEDDYEIDIAHELLQTNKEGLTKREQYAQIIEKSKQLREEKHKQRENTKDKIKQLDEDFAEINDLLKKRKRNFEMKNDEYYKNVSQYQYADKTTPTDRIKTEEEIEKDKLKKLEKLKNKHLEISLIDIKKRL